MKIKKINPTHSFSSESSQSCGKGNSFINNYKIFMSAIYSVVTNVYFLLGQGFGWEAREHKGGTSHSANKITKKLEKLTAKL